ncbi:MAG: hypothetical protein ACI8RD_007848 [Bacillariaceae sp.]|jgi:hypothetical protein
MMSKIWHNDVKEQSINMFHSWETIISCDGDDDYNAGNNKISQQIN